MNIYDLADILSIFSKYYDEPDAHSLSNKPHAFILDPTDIAVSYDDRIKLYYTYGVFQNTDNTWVIPLND